MTVNPQALLRIAAVGVLPTLERCGQTELAQILREAALDAMNHASHQDEQLAACQAEIKRLVACLEERDAKIAEMLGEARRASL